MVDIAAHVEERRRWLAEARAAREELWTRRIEQAIDPSLGVVAVDVWGNLLEVELDRAGLRATDPRTVGAKILHAIRAAEERAARAVEENASRWS